MGIGGGVGYITVDDEAREEVRRRGNERGEKERLG